MLNQASRDEDPLCQEGRRGCLPHACPLPAASAHISGDSAVVLMGHAPAAPSLPGSLCGRPLGRGNRSGRGS